MTYNEAEVLKTRKQRRAIIAKQLRHLESCVEQVRGLLILESMERPSRQPVEISAAVGEVRTATGLHGHQIDSLYVQ